MSRLYSYSRGRLRYHVLVNDDGSIKVHWGDWLSKYAVAIYGTPLRVQEFARMGQHGLLPIKNLNMIYAGEKLYHAPTYYAKHGAAVLDRPAPPLPLTDADKKRLALEHFVHEFDLKGDDVRVVSDWLDHLHVIDELVVEIGECIVELAGTEIAAGSAIWATGFIGGLLNALLVPAMATFQLLHKLESGDRICQMAAIAVGITAWAYGEGPPPFRLPNGAYKVSDTERQTNAQAWQVGCNQALDAVEKMIDTVVAAFRANFKLGIEAAPRSRLTIMGPRIRGKSPPATW
jgi:hypothetical protein